MKRLIAIISALALSLTLVGCSSGISATEKFVCDVLFESWPKIDLSEANNFTFLYESSGVSRLGDNSESSRRLSQNSQMAMALREQLSEDDDKKLSELVRLHRFSPLRMVVPL